MTTPPQKKMSRALLFGCLGPLFTCLALALVLVISEPIKSSFNLCNLSSPAGCRNIYRVGGTVDLGKTLALSVDGRFLAIGNRDLLIFDTETAQVKASALVQSDSANGCDSSPAPVAISPDGAYAAGYTIASNCVFLLQSANGRLEKLQGPEKSDVSVALIAFSPDGQALFYNNAAGTQVLRYDLAQKRSEKYLEARGPLDISPQGLMVVAVKDGLQLWRIADPPRLEASLPLEAQEISEAAISLDEKMLAVSFYLPNTENREWKTQLLETGAGKVLADQLQLYGLDFSPDGKFLTTMGFPSTLYAVNPDGTVSKAWESGRLAFSLYDPFGFSPSNLALDSKGGWMYYGDVDMVARFRIP